MGTRKGKRVSLKRVVSFSIVSSSSCSSFSPYDDFGSSSVCLSQPSPSRPRPEIPRWRLQPPPSPSTSSLEVLLLSGLHLSSHTSVFRLLHAQHMAKPFPSSFSDSVTFRNSILALFLTSSLVTLIMWLIFSILLRLIFWNLSIRSSSAFVIPNFTQGRATGGFQGFRNPPFLGNNVDFFSIFAIFVTVLFFYFSLIETKPSLDFKSSQKNHFQNSLVMNLQANRSACNIIFFILFKIKLEPPLINPLRTPLFVLLFKTFYPVSTFIFFTL